MIDELFLRLLNMSLTAGWLVAVMLLLRKPLRRATGWLRWSLWGMVALRLVFPFSITSIFSLIPSAEPLNPHLLYTIHPTVDTGFVTLDDSVNPVLETYSKPALGDSIHPLQVVAMYASLIWAAGVLAMLLYMLISTLRIRKRMKDATPLEGEKRVFLSDKTDIPFVLGVIRPRIYLPASLDTAAYEPILRHERAHIRHGDHVWKPLGFLLLAVYWFHPLLWLGYRCFTQDIELTCDERVIRHMDGGARKQYSQALLDCSVNRPRIMTCPLAFGGESVKQRVTGVLRYRKPAIWLVAVSVIACIVAALCFLTNPPKGNQVASNSAVAADPAVVDFVDYAVLMHHPVQERGTFYFSAAHILAAGADKNGAILTAAIAVQEYQLEEGKAVLKKDYSTPVFLSFKDSEMYESGYNYYEAADIQMAALYQTRMQDAFPELLGKDNYWENRLADATKACTEKAERYFGSETLTLVSERSLYRYNNPETGDYATMILEPNGEMRFDQSMFSSIIFAGAYCFHGDRLMIQAPYMAVDNYCFERQADGNLRFTAAGSDNVQQFSYAEGEPARPAFADGAVFVRQMGE